MRIPYSWLKDYVDVELEPAALAERLTMAGLEVDRVEYPWPGIVTAEIIWQERIPGSDHLWATRVSVGPGTEELSVVCGAPNIQPHDKVPLARVGAKVGDMTIGEKRAMGVLSQGMLCSPHELGLSDDHSGIYILPPETPLGVPLGQLLGGAVLDLDIKAHRGDLFCLVGIAREVSAFTDKPLRQPEVAVREKGTAVGKLMRLDVRDTDLCPRYTARVVQGITIGPSPRWMADRLLAAGMRPINNVVDVTNYVMLELGQPLHAFDYDKVTDHTIIVRRAVPGERITTLDGVERALTSEMLLITDPAGPMVIAGIFGGSRVEVSDETTSLLLEAAHFAPTNIRRTAQALGLRTESSGRFEKNPDIALTAPALDRAARLITELAGGTIAPGWVDVYPTPVTPRQLTFHLSQVEWLTGMRVTPSEATAVLRGLGFGVEEAPSDGSAVVLRLTIPTWRGDVEESADVVEEITRILGFDRIPSTLPVGALPTPNHDPWYEREDAVRELLLGAGLTEVITYPLTSRPAMARLLRGAMPGEELQLTAPAAVAELTAPADGTHTASHGRAQDRRQIEAVAERLPAIILRNPGSSEMDALRLTLMSGLLSVVRENSKHEDAGLWFFELGRRYLPTPGLSAGAELAHERRTLGVALTGPRARDWLGDARDADFFDLKGAAQTLLSALKASAYRFVPATHPTFHPGRCALLEVRPVAEEREAAQATTSSTAALAEAREQTGWVPVGILGEVHPEVAARFDLPGRTYLMELDLERLFLGVPDRVRYQPIARFPAAQRDLAVVVDRQAPAGEIAAAIWAGGGALVRSVQLFDVYTGEGIPPDKKSLAYALIYQSPERTLTEAEIEAAHAAVVKALAERFGATPRA
ncbi:MAG: phenylalanine--tRNA ligase subunit beta [Ktedonobacterales bacterium]|nr:phenylalanine--tRNA ligase subunit beta [Ktedonobacterales bacterium]